MKMRFALTLCVAGLLLASAPAFALVNPALQPVDLWGKYNAVVVAEVQGIEGDDATLKVVRVLKGKFEPKQITIHAPESEDEDDMMMGGESVHILDDIMKGQPVVAFVGKSRRRHEGDVLLYGGSNWHTAEAKDLKDFSKWTWQEAQGDAMYGTFNGAPEQMRAMAEDAAAGRDFFPAVPFVKFAPAKDLAKFGAAPAGVALYDVDGDGDLDVYACCPEGDRLLLQTAPLKFEDRTKAMGLAGLASRSVGFADANADGRGDLLADGAIYLGGEKGFAKSELLPASVGEKLKLAAFVEINGDGYPDVVVSRVGGGLAVYRNPGEKGGAFADATKAAGLDASECGAGGTGFFMPGDWNADGRTDLFYAVEPGLLLVQGKDGRFAPVEHEMRIDYATRSGKPGQTGAGCFGAIWRETSTDIVSATDTNIMLVISSDGKPIIATGWGNEITESSGDQLATLAEDLNVDGRVDLFTISSSPNQKNVFHTNRGYGSFMLAEKYEQHKAFPGKAHSSGARGIATGDVNGDGANDLLLSGADGTLRLVLNDSLSLRVPKERPLRHEQVLLDTRILSVKVKGKRGVVGASVRVLGAAGKPVALRGIGTKVLTGCRSADEANIAVRKPGKYTVEVRYADGLVRKMSADVTEKKRVELAVTRP